MAVRDALIAALSLDPSQVSDFALDAREGPSPGWNAALTVDLPTGSITLDVGDARTPRDAWFRTAHLAWAYRSTHGGDPFADAVSAQWLKDLRRSAGDGRS